jgi:soluble lytic murein transglycosylase-like protein
MVFPVKAGFEPLNYTLYGPEKIPQKETQKEPQKSSSRAVAKRQVDGKKIISSPSGTQDGRNYGKGEVQDLIRKYSQQYGISSEAPLCIAKHESGFNPNARNKSSSASGVFQYLSSTWEATDEGLRGNSVFSAEANIKAAVKYMGVHRSTKPWVASKNCPPLTFL